MNKIIFVLLLAFVGQVLAKDPRVVYKKASPEENAKAQKLLLDLFDPNKDFSVTGVLFDKLLLCPAGLWEQLKAHPAVSNLSQGVLKARVPRVQDGSVMEMIERPGKLLQSKAEIEAFWKAFSNNIKVTGTPKVRKLNELEIDVLWTMIPFPIEEPCFIVEWKQHQILVWLKDGKIFWIDELNSYMDRSGGKEL